MNEKSRKLFRIAQTTKRNRYPGKKKRCTRIFPDSWIQNRSQPLPVKFPVVSAPWGMKEIKQITFEKLKLFRE